MATAVSRATLEVLLDRVHQGVATLSPEATLTYLNQRFASMLGRNRAELVGKPLAELVAAAERDALVSAIAAGRDTAAQCRIAMPRTNGGGELQALLTFAPLGHGQASCLVTDLGEGSHVGALAHEVRSVLGNVRDAVEILKHSTLESDARRALATLERQSRRVSELLSSPQ